MFDGLLSILGARKSPAIHIPHVPVLTAKRATDLYGVPDGDPHGAWAKEHIVYCGGGGKAPLPAMPGVPPHLWFAVHKRCEPKLREAFKRAQAACPTYAIGSAGGWVFRHQRHDPNRPLSNHAWGAAVDVDAATNGARDGLSASLVPWSREWMRLWPNGLPQAWVEAFVSVGGVGWGGMWRPWNDAMHVEVYDPEG